MIQVTVQPVNIEIGEVLRGQAADRQADSPFTAVSRDDPMQEFQKPAIVFFFQTGGHPLYFRVSFQCVETAPLYLSRSASGATPDRLRARRKPLPFVRYVGSQVRRNADRQYAASLTQLPPRFTRSEPS